MCCVFVWNIKGENLYESGTDIDLFFFLVSNDQNIGLILTKSYKKDCFLCRFVGACSRCVYYELLWKDLQDDYSNFPLVVYEKEKKNRL